MKGINTEKGRIRHKVFTEVARFAYEGNGPEVLDELPYQMVNGDDDPYRHSLFLERAIVGARIRVAMGMAIRPVNEHTPTSKGVDASMIEEKYYEPPLIDIIRFACHCCPEKRVYITDGCQNCLEHPCMEVCPKKCISYDRDLRRNVIDTEKCIKCGMCMKACQYNAIIRQERPCVAACGLGAIGEDDYGHAMIYQTINAMQSGTPVYAIVAPAIAGQFGKELTDTRMKSAFGKLGFKDVFEVAIGADLCTIEEAEHFLREVPESLPFMCTSCCPAWSIMAKTHFPEYAETVSMALTPMVLTARLVKKLHPDCKIAFIGPCLSKKHEASRHTVKSYVDFVLTFEELAGMFDARGVVFSECEEGEPLRKASSDGFGFAIGGGVAQAVANHIKRVDPEREVKIVRAEGLGECMKMMKKAAAGEYNGYLLEGMACPGGCVAGAGTLQPLNKAVYSVGVAQKEAPVANAIDSKYADLLPALEHIQEELSKQQDDLEPINRTKISMLAYK